jgi:two-component system, OmpR family, phosphate regulon response regulator PhoB
VLTCKLLIVDDVGQLRKLVRYTVGYGLYEVHEAANGAEGLEKARSIVPDVMILDVMMPDMSGFQVCGAVKQDPRLKSVFVVLLSARGEPADLEEGKRAGADAYVVKPFDPQKLLEVIESRPHPAPRGATPH